MEKPITVARQEFSEKLAALINESQLHPLILLPVMKEASGQLEVALAQITARERNEYEESLKHEEGNQSDEA